MKRINFEETTITFDVLLSKVKEVFDLLLSVLDTSKEFDLSIAEFQPVHRQLNQLGEFLTQHNLNLTTIGELNLAIKDGIFAVLPKKIDLDRDNTVRLFQIIFKILDQLTLATFDSFREHWEKTILAQQQELLEMSTPIIEIWEGVLAFPVIGTLDSHRTQIAMENLLTKMVQKKAKVAILDVTGVALVDTMVAQHLIKTVTAARLMGAECIITGLRPSIAMTMVNLGIDLNGIITRHTMSEGLKESFRILKNHSYTDMIEKQDD